jgi:hypothetical protein
MQLQGNHGTIRGSDLYTLIMDLLLTKQDLHLELEHTKEQKAT